MAEPRVSELFIYPVKSAAGIQVSAAAVTVRGFAHDRRWMVVDPEGGFLTQRSHPRMALIRTGLTDTTLELDAPGMPRLSLPLHPLAGAPRRVQVWRDTCDALDCGQEAAAWLTGYLQTPCGLTFMPDSTQRRVDPTYARDGETVGFADGFPFLLISDASLADLNARLPTPVPMNRFRPNIVVTGCAPFAEDTWDTLTIAGVTLWPVKQCSRCTVVTVAQDRGERGPEPLRTLATYRKVRGKVMFGQNLVHRGSGAIRVGDGVQVTSRPPAGG